jgi:hypothetical protein
MTSKLMALPAIEYNHVVSSGQLQVSLTVTWCMPRPPYHILNA